MSATDPGHSAPVLKFRPDIDGLRALAIGAVLFYHFDLLGARGGFAGVDMFFVVSGYLMTSMLSRAVPSRAMIVSFYRRRFWRIVPAYAAMIALTLVVGAIWLLPVDAERLGMSAVAAIAFVPNIFFASGVGYFDTAAIYKPLLHTWSLGVEAQFYLVWPLFVVCFTRLRPPARIASYVAVVLVSLVFCQVFAITDAKVAFFSLPARLWQFGLGALVVEAPRLGSSRPAAHVASALRTLAFATVLATPWLVGDGDAWPAPFAIPICGSTAILLWLGGGPDALTTRVLSSPPIAFIGRISYSLYLVHWPVVVLINYAHFPQAPVGLRIAALIACVPLAAALYHLVETPLRDYGRTASLPRWNAAALALVPLGALAGGYALHLDPTAFHQQQRVADDAAGPGFVCLPWRGAQMTRSYCLIGAADSTPRILLWGDSHARQFVPAFETLLAHGNESIALAIKDACPPIAGVMRVSNAILPRQDCLHDNAATLADIRASASIETIIIAARWAFYAETTRFGNEKGGRAFLITPNSAKLSVARSRRFFTHGLDSEINLLLRAGKHVILVAQVPEMGFDAWRCVAMDGGATCDLPRPAATARQAHVDAVLGRLAKRPGVRLVDPKDVLCDAKLCRATIDGEPAYRDDNHISAAAAQRVVERMFTNIGGF